MKKSGGHKNNGYNKDDMTMGCEIRVQLKRGWGKIDTTTRAMLCVIDTEQHWSVYSSPRCIYSNVQ